jgi:hypothetical protein
MSPERLNSRTARASAASMMRASVGSRSQMNDTTQPSHAEVACWVQSSQLMVSVSMNHSMDLPCDRYRHDDHYR